MEDITDVSTPKPVSDSEILTNSFVDTAISNALLELGKEMQHDQENIHTQVDLSNVQPASPLTNVSGSLQLDQRHSPLVTSEVTTCPDLTPNENAGNCADCDCSNSQVCNLNKTKCSCDNCDCDNCDCDNCDQSEEEVQTDKVDQSEEEVQTDKVDQSEREVQTTPNLDYCGLSGTGNIVDKVEEEMLNKAINDTAEFIVEEAEQLIKDVAAKLEDSAEKLVETIAPPNTPVDNHNINSKQSMHKPKPTKTVDIMGKKITIDANKNTTVAVVGTLVAAAAVTGLALLFSR